MWEFHVIPQSGEANYGTWPSTDLKDRSGANMWSTMTVDEPRDLIYAGLGDANRPGPEGKNLYTGSLVAIDARTGKMKWFHQLIHHDIWDFDMPTPPLLVDVRRNGRVIPAVFLTGKNNLVFMFNRDTGEPLYGMTERPVPRSDNPGGLFVAHAAVPRHARADRPRRHEQGRHQQDDARDRKVLHRLLGQRTTSRRRSSIPFR